MTTLVTGARGAVATALIGLLRERGLPVRPASKAPADPSVVRCDLGDPSTFGPALEGVTSVFLYADPSHAQEFAAAAEAAGVEQVVLLSSAAVLMPDPDSSPLAATHLVPERALAASSVPSTVLRPGTFCGNAMAWSWAIKSGTPISLPYPHAHVDAIHEADIAAVAAAVLADPALGGRAYTLTGPQSLTFSEQVAILSRVTGRDIAITPVTRQEWTAEMAQYMDAALAEALLDYWQSCDGRPIELTSVVEELTGTPARTFASWAEENRAAFLGQ